MRTGVKPSSAPHLSGATTTTDLVDWGPQPEALDGTDSRSSGVLLYKGDEADDGLPESGLWVCTPGRWRLSIPRDELCHFLAGRATYVADDGETIEAGPGTVVHFEAGWTGTCTVHDTIRNVYMLR